MAKGKTQKPKLTLVKGTSTFDGYKNMIDSMCFALTGQHAKMTDEEWQKAWEKFSQDKPKEEKPSDGET